ncbi:hypothetical protein AAG906_026408 [Vitis piasezkii]
MWRTLQKQDRGAKPRKQSIAFEGAKFSHDGNQGANSSVQRVEISHTSKQGAKLISRCETDFKPETQKTPSTEKPRNPEQPPPFISAMAKTRRPFRLPIITDASTTSKPPWEAPPPIQAPPFPIRGELLLNADTPPGMPPTDLCHHRSSQELLSRPPKENQVLGSREPSHHLGQLGLRDRSFHSKTYFDIEALRQQPELRDSFRLLQRYHMEDLLTPRQFYYPE